MSILDFQIPPFKYFPTQLWEEQGPKQWARVRLMQACRRLAIPTEVWPTFEENISLPAKYGFKFQWGPAYRLPAFQALYESPGEWKARAQSEFEEHCYRFLTWAEEQIERQVHNGSIRPVPQPRDKKVPLDLRFEWAARRICLKEQYKAMATEQHSPDKIRKVVNEILKTVAIRRRK